MRRLTDDVYSRINQFAKKAVGIVSVFRVVYPEMEPVFIVGCANNIHVTAGKNRQTFQCVKSIGPNGRDRLTVCF